MTREQWLRTFLALSNAPLPVLDAVYVLGNPSPGAMLSVLLALLSRHGVVLWGDAFHSMLQWRSANHDLEIRLYLQDDELAVGKQDGRLLRQLGSAYWDCGQNQQEDYRVLEAHDACWEP